MNTCKHTVEYLDVKNLKKSRELVATMQKPLERISNNGMQNNDRPWFSMIIPTYNRSYIICNAIDSLNRQTYQNFEIIIVDDGSTDNTEEMIREQYADMISYGKLRYIKTTNGGVCKARNIGLKNAQYEWIGYVDSDNVVSDDYLETYVQAIYEHPEAKAFYAKLIRIGDKGIVGSEFDLDSLLAANYIDIGTYIHKKSLVNELGNFDENMTRLVDWELIVRFSKKYPPIYINRIVLFYNDGVDPSRITNGINLYYNLNYFKKKHCDYPLVTTIVLSYNQAKYIEYALDSAMKQEGKFVHEILVSDDGSKDGTHDIIHDYAARYPDMVFDISNQTNKGISENYRKCFKKAHGEYIAVLEGDDYWIDAHKNEKQMLFLRDNVDCSMVFSGIKTLKDGNFGIISARNGLNSKITGKDLLQRGEGLIVNFSCVMYRKKLISNIPKTLYNFRLSELALAFYFDTLGKIGFIKDIGTVYRIREDGVWSGANLKDQLVQKRAVREIALQVCREEYKGTFVSILRELNKQIELLELGSKYKIRKQLYTIRHSDYFDAKWYRKKYNIPQNVDPASHYLLSDGWKFNPSLEFNGKEYFSLYYDVAKKGLNPLAHYEEFGKKEGRSISWDEAIEKAFPDEKLPGLVREKTPSFSIIVASYNYEDLVVETLKSLINQTYQNFEIVVVDDGSPDNSLENIKSFIKQNSNRQIPIKVLTHPDHKNHGLAATIKLALKNCKGTYVAFCECDDLWSQDHLEEVARMVVKSAFHARILINDVDIFGNVERFPYADGIRNFRLKRMNKAINWITPKEFRLRNWIITFSCVCVRRDILLRCNFDVKGTPETIDWWLWRQICYDTPIFFIDKKLTYWRLHASYMTRRVNNPAIQRKRLDTFLVEGDKILQKQHPGDSFSWVTESSSSGRRITRKDDSFVRYNYNNELQEQLKTIRFDYDSMRNSVSFRIGRKITWGPRKIRGAIRCFHEHGSIYTLKRTIEHFGINMGTGDFRK